MHLHADMLVEMHVHLDAWWRICPKHGHHSGPSLIPQDGPPVTSSAPRAATSSIKTPHALSDPKEVSNEWDKQKIRAPIGAIAIAKIVQPRMRLTPR